MKTKRTCGCGKPISGGRTGLCISCFGRHRLAKQDRNAAIVASHLAGLSNARIGREHGICGQRVGFILAREGYASRRVHPCALPPMSEEDARVYRKLRRLLGAPEARKAMGLPGRSGPA